LTEAPAAGDAPRPVERAISATLEHHAHLRLMPALGRRAEGPGAARRCAGCIVEGVDEGLPIAYGVLEKGIPVLASDGKTVGTVHHVVAAPRRTSSTGS